MALNINTNITNNYDGYLLDAQNVKGTFVVVQDYIALSTIPSATRVVGSLAYCQTEVTVSDVTYPIGFYQYDGSTWIEANLGGSGSGLFECTYDTTLYDEVSAAIDDGLLPYVTYNSLIHLYGGAVSDVYRFVAIWNNTLSYVTLDDTDVWANGSVTFEVTSNKVTSISSQSTDTEYPSAKLLYDQLLLKQDTLVPGDNIQIDSSTNTISATDSIPNDATLTIQANGSTVGTFSADADSDVTINITAESLGLSAPLDFIGVSTTDPQVGGATVAGHTTWSAGEVVIYQRSGESGYEEFVNIDGNNTSSSWELLGDADSYALKSIQINTGTGLTGGGDLTQNRTLSLADNYGDTKNPYASKSANLVLASPNGESGTPTFRPLTATDIQDALETLTISDIDAIWSGGYPITVSVTNGTATLSQNKILLGSVTVTITPNEDYLLPIEVAAENADVAYNIANGQVVLSNPTGNVSLTATCRHIASARVDGLGSENTSDFHANPDAHFTIQNLGINTDYQLGEDHFVMIPTLYRKIESFDDNQNPTQITSFSISNVQSAGFEPYPCFVAEDDTTILPYILIGKYWNSDPESMVSVELSDEDDAEDLSIANARTYARNRGLGYQQYDWMIHKLWQDLIIIFKGTINTNSGVPEPSTSDELDIYWGDYYPAWVDGIGTFRAQGDTQHSIVICKHPSQYVNEPTSETEGYEASSYKLPVETASLTDRNIVKLGYDAQNPFVNYPVEMETNGDYNTYYCDSVILGTGLQPHCLWIHTIAPDEAEYGAFFCDMSNRWSNFKKSVRLCYRPISS